MGKKNEYILGVNQTELERLEFQNKVWKKLSLLKFLVVNIKV